MDADRERFRQQRLRTFYPKTDTVLPDDVLRAGVRPGDVPDRLAADLCRRHLGVEPLSAVALDGQGTFHHLTRVTLADGRRVVVRVHARAEHARDLALGVDAWAMARLRQAGLPWLPVYRVDVSRRDHSFEYEILGEAEGTELAAFYPDEPRLSILLGRLGRFLGRLHEISLPGYGWIDVDPDAVDPATAPARGVFDSWPAFVATNLDAHVEGCVRIGVLEAQEGRRIVASFAERAGLFEIPTGALLHGDLSGRNVFTDGAEITAVIDWEDCLAGDPVFDLAFWATFHQESRYPALLDGYASVRPLPADFHDRFWLYYLRVALSKTLLRHRFGYPDRQPGFPPASRRIHIALARLDGASAPSA
jgi:Ser/Thr protein kinase RdoA (MazF antagonist)